VELGGWAGRLLFVDLTTGHISFRETSAYGPAYIGGRGLGAVLAWEMLYPGITPFDPENPLMFLSGPLAGTSAPSSGRITICSLAPQAYPISWFSRASMGGNFAHQLKYAGLDGIIITGQAEHPVFIRIFDQEIEICDAQEIWGLGILATQQELRRKLGQKVEIAAIGPAGETGSCIASIGTGEAAAAGQGGFGAVMGAKKLKAIAIYGTGRPKLAHPKAFKAFARAIAREKLLDDRSRPTGASRTFPYMGQRHHCSTGCVVGCGQYYDQIPGRIFPDKQYNGVLQCVAWRFPGFEGHYWNLGFEAGFELNMWAIDWGINHWDLTKGLFPWIGMCYREGLQELGGRKIEPDSPRFWYDVLQAIATHKGPLAEIVADGGRRAIARTGLLPEEARQIYTGWGYANHWDGRGPRGNRIPYPFWLTSALLWMVDTRDPMGSAHGYVQRMLRASPFGQNILSWEKLQALGDRLYGRPEAMDPLSNYEGKAEPALWHARRSLLKDSLPLCDLVFPRLFTSLTKDGLPIVEGVKGPDFEAHLYRLATGLEVSPEELEQTAERALTLERAEQLRDFGRTRETDAQVLRFFCETVEEYPNPLLQERKRAEWGPLNKLADEFYTLHGWDPVTGSPTLAHLKELGLQDVAQALIKMKLLPSSPQGG